MPKFTIKEVTQQIKDTRKATRDAHRALEKAENAEMVALTRYGKHPDRKQREAKCKYGHVSMVTVYPGDRGECDCICVKTMYHDGVLSSYVCNEPLKWTKRR